MPDCGCYQAILGSRDLAYAFITQQVAMAANRGHDLYCHEYPELKWELGKKQGKPTGRSKVNFWYPGRK